MSTLNPSALAMVPFVSVQDMMRIVNAIGPRQMLREVCAYIEADFARWELFDKTPRIPAHSEEGVIELMPTSDGHYYGFKYVNKNNQLEKIKVQPTKNVEPKFHIALVLVKEVNWPLNK